MINSLKGKRNLKYNIIRFIYMKQYNITGRQTDKLNMFTINPKAITKIIENKQQYGRFESNCINHPINYI